MENNLENSMKNELPAAKKKPMQKRAKSGKERHFGVTAKRTAGKQ